MKTLVTTSLTLAAAIAVGLTAAPNRAQAAGSDLGYDSVTKIVMGQSSGPPPAPGTFQPDFQTASTPAQNGAPHGGMFGKLMGNAMGMMASFKSGTAERHYYGTTKFRSDNVAQGTGDITDCTARTLTHLDLNAKTYHVTSLDQPETPSGISSHSGAPGPAATDDGTKMAMDITTTAIGPLTIEGVATNGYTMNMKMTVTKADGETATTNSAMTSYYSSMDDPHTSCPEHFSMSGMGQGGPGGANIAQMMLAMKGVGSKGDPRFKITNSGPAIPSGKLAMWQMMTMRGGDGGSAGFGMVTERGNVHQLSDADPAFRPPADFTKV